MNLILLRHGESEWNLENRFTGWKDVGLTPKGRKEAEFSATQLLKENYKIQSVFTSLLNRATETTSIVVKSICYNESDVKYEWRLNERHYGALQGLNKSETAAKYGEEQVQIWRRSFDTPPPFLKKDDTRHPRFNKKFSKIDNSDLPSGESLKMVIERLNPFWDKYFGNLKMNGNSHLIVAHSNSLRAIVKILENLSNEDIMKVNIPTGVPLVYTFDDDKKVLDKKYLIDNKELQKKQDLVISQGRV
jgi:2,3-bisphosphoglycerate-dependent phosphoglycerate mutase